MLLEGEAQLRTVGLGHLARAIVVGGYEIASLVPLCLIGLLTLLRTARPLLWAPLNKATRAFDADYKEPTPEGVRWLCVWGCPVLPILPWFRCERSHRKEAWELLPVIQGKNLKPGQLFPPGSAGDWC